jgi:putative acetyltransferase
VLLRHESAADRQGVRIVNELVFGHPDEADLVDALRQEGAVLLSLVAEMEGQIVGHILFTRMFVGPVEAVALAPMGVLPEYQRLQIGSKLVHQGLAELRDRGERIVLVLGHKEYYPRFGFSAEKASALSHPFPAEAYMALELEEGALAGIQGSVRYPASFRIA